MENYNILKIKLTAILSCIDQYTSEPSIKTILDETYKAMECKDFETLTYLTKEISLWYKKNIAEIIRNTYVDNKEIHVENSENINAINDILTKNSKKFHKEVSSDSTQKNNDLILSNIINL